MARLVDDIRRYGIVRNASFAAVGTEQDEEAHRAGLEMTASQATMVDLAIGGDSPVPVFDVTAVADEIAARKEGIEADPSGMRPPFDLMWIEYRVPPEWGKGTVHRVGVVALVDEAPSSPDAAKGWMRQLAEPCFAELAVRNEQRSPVSMVVMFLVLDTTRFGGRDRYYTGFGAWSWLLDEQGDAISNGWIGQAANEQGPAFSSLVLPAAAALSILNCANVGIRAHAPRPRLQRKRQSAGLPELVTFHTLTVRPPGARAPSSPDGGSDALSEALTRLHLRRGHFADYRNGKGLFGREELRRRFWISPTMVGSSEQGRVDKDYRVEPTN